MTNKPGSSWGILTGAVVFALAGWAEGQSEPVRIYAGEKSQTKTNMHQYVDSPDGKRYAFRYFSGDDQPPGRRGSASPCEIWICNSDLTGHHKAFPSPKGEGGHGSDVIVWVTNDLIYYAGISYQISTRTQRWRFEGGSAELPLARMGPVSANKLYVGIRKDPIRKGWYWLDPSSPSLPKLHVVNDMKNLVPYYEGSWEDAEATYIHQNPSDTKLHVVVYDRKKGKEYAFVLNAEDGSVHSFLGHNRAGFCGNGHVLWYDDGTLVAGNKHPGLFDLEGKLIKRLAPAGNHLSLSQDRSWWVADTRYDPEVRLHRFGSESYVVVSGDVEYFGDYHPSFSRDGRYVFFAGKRKDEPHPGVYRVDVSAMMKEKAKGSE